MLNHFKQLIISIILFVIVKINCDLQQQQPEQVNQFAIAPILDIDDEKIGYVGTIGERNVLVDLKPHLQIRNIDQINGICSYHVFKPNNEEFPFTIDIKDKTTGEAVIEVLKKDLEITPSSKVDSAADNKFILLDCNKRKEFTFLIQAHDCSTPSLPSNKVPVKIEVLDHDDFLLKFDNADTYSKRLSTSNMIYENIMTIKAKDNDCTNEGNACSYQLISSDEAIILDDKFSFKIDTNGILSSTQSLNNPKIYDFKVRAFDCLNKNSYVDAPVRIEIVEQCTPQWINNQQELTPTSEQTNLFDQLKIESCDEHDKNLVQNKDSCKIETVNSILKLDLESTIKNECTRDENCDPETDPITSKITLFSGKMDESSTEDSDNEDSDDEDDDLNDESIEDENKIEKIKPKEPLNYRSFSKEIKNAQKIDFDGNFGNEFSLNVWLRRPANADKQIKEQVLCGTDSNTMNRHHIGLYFYRGNIKFLMRKESTTQTGEKNEKFYPSLWQWQLDESIINDAKWHFYEIKLNYPKASLYIDNVLFSENLTNSDIIDAYELKNTNEVEPLSTYIGACFHARTKSLVDHFEGDIGPLKLVKTTGMKKLDQSDTAECKMSCNEAIQINLIGNENLITSVKNVNTNEISIQTSNLNDMSQILSKINYVNQKLSNPQLGLRKIILKTTIKCVETEKQINLNELNLNLNVKHPKREYNVQITGDKQVTVLKSQLANGVKPFSKVSIEKAIVNQIDDDDDDDSKSQEQGEDIVDLSKCQIHVSPLMIPNEKINHDQILLDQFKLEIKFNNDLILISGSQNIKNYEMFIRTLTYQATDDSLNDKQFQISCVKSEPSIETNTLTIQFNITNDEVRHEPIASKYVAHKQKSQLFASDSDDDLIQSKDYKLNHSNEMSTPLIIALIVMCSCAMGFLLIFGAVRLRSSGFFGNKKKNLINEENPQMEWDDSGLNITENPLEILENKKCKQIDGLNNELEDDEEYSSYEEGDEEEEDDEEDDDEEEDQEYEEDEHYSSDEELQEKVINRELEWDDTAIEIKEKQKNLSNKSNKRASSSVNDFNKFV